MRQEHGEGHRGEREQGEARVDDEHGCHKGQGEEHGVPGLDGELSYADAKHLDVTDEPGHQIPEGRPLQIRHGPRQHSAERVRSNVRAYPRVGGHEPPAFPDARYLGQQGAADEGEGRPADIDGRGFAPLQGQHSVDGTAKKDRGQDDGGIHDDAGHGTQGELARHLSEVRPHPPEKGKHEAGLGR